MRKVGDQTPVGEIDSERMAFDNKFYPVIERVVKTPEGALREPQLLWDRSGKRFVAAVVTDEAGRYVLVRERKFGQMRLMVSTPTGGIKQGETDEAAAAREVLAETGYTADRWYNRHIGPFVDFADKTDGGEHVLVVAKNARKITEPRDPGQELILATEAHLMQLIFGGDVPMMSVGMLLMSMRMK